MSFPYIYRFRIALNGVTPRIWRRILVPEWFTFYELHCAIQDAMGWKHRHPYMFHDFSLAPEEDICIKHPEGPLPLSEIDVEMKFYFVHPEDSAQYVYDFGCSAVAESRNWEHTITLDRIHWEYVSGPYVSCVGGERACPPEGLAGGVANYDRHCQALNDPDDPDHDRCVEFANSVGASDDPEEFYFELVVFSDPVKRYKEYLSQPNGESGGESGRESVELPSAESGGESGGGTPSEQPTSIPSVAIEIEIETS